MARRFVESEHPRHPRGSSKGGEFRDKFGGDWASIVSGRISAIAGGGSVATGKTATCPGCGRTVKVVGNGVLSTHNISKGKRCPGSGSKASAEPKQKIGGAKRPPVPPQVRVGRPLHSVHDMIGGDRKAAERMRIWRARTTHATGASKVGELRTARRNLAGYEESLKSGRSGAEWRMRQDMRYMGLDPDEPLDRASFGWDAKLDVATGPERHNVTAAQLRLQQAEQMTAGRPFDPADPLAYYGDRLHIEGDSWHIYQALDVLEQRVPPVFHRVAAEYVHTLGGDAGIYIGDTQTIPELDNLSHLKGKKPRGWAKGKTYADVDGVVSNDSIMVVTHTANTESHRRSRATEYFGMPGAESIDASATLHEFGHLLDSALGTRKNRWRVEDLSERRLFRLLHSRVKKTAGKGLSPYFRQRGNAGPQEFFADAFGVWAQASPEPWTSDYVPTGMEVGKSWIGMGRGVDRRATWQDIVISRTYRIDVGLAAEVTDYFNRLLREAESGKLVPAMAVVM